MAIICTKHTSCESESENMQLQERRSVRRLPLSSRGYAIFNGIDLDLKTHDISQSGALVEFCAPYSIRKGAKLRIHFHPGLAGMAIVCRVIPDNDRTLFALKFENPIFGVATIH